MNFKNATSFEDRKSESSKIMEKYPQRIPIIIEKAEKCVFNDIQKKKYLVPKDINMNNIIFIIRNKIQLDKSQSIFLMIDRRLCPSNTPIGSIYEDYKDEDGFLYVTYTSENTFG